MHARIIGIRQELSFEDGEAANYMVMELPNGSRIQAPIDDETLRELTVSFVDNGGVAAEQAVARARSEKRGPEHTKMSAEQMRQQAEASTAHPALVNPMGSPNTAVDDSHAPLSIQDGGEGDAGEYVFGGDYQGGTADEEEELHNLQQQFHQASERVHQAASTGNLGEAVQALSQPQSGTLPTPSWAAEVVAATPPRTKMRRVSVASPVALAAVQVSADSKGNPILRGEGLVDPLELTGQTDEQGEAAQI